MPYAKTTSDQSLQRGFDKQIMKFEFQRMNFDNYLEFATNIFKFWQYVDCGLQQSFRYSGTVVQGITDHTRSRIQAQINSAMNE